MSTVEELYGPQCMTVLVHHNLHSASKTRQFGPLLMNGAFMIESAIRQLLFDTKTTGHQERGILHSMVYALGRRKLSITELIKLLKVRILICLFDKSFRFIL